MSDNFYRSFEEKYRGSRKLILSRLEAYLCFTSPLKKIYSVLPAIDLGCGRGEWLELLLQEGFIPRGVDQDDGMLQGCLDLNLAADKGDIIEYLSKISNESQTIVSAFHVVEHISFDQLRILVSEALRVLKPGGLLIMETPNPENIIVATRNFYLDPTHQRPIPPQLLSFLPEYYGFFRTKIIRLQESKELARNVSPTLNDVLDGVSPDYAVIAQKAASPEILELFNQTFDQEYGLELTTLAERYDAAILEKIQQAKIIAQQAEEKVQQAEEKVQQAEEKAQQAEEKAQQAEEKAQQAEEKVQQAEIIAQQAGEKAQQAEIIAQQAEEKAQQAEIIAQQAEEKAQQAEIITQQANYESQKYFAQLQSIYVSKSWRLTEPLRNMYRAIILMRGKK